MSNSRVLRRVRDLSRGAPRLVSWASTAAFAAVLLACRVGHAATAATQASAGDLASILATYGPSIGAMYVLYLGARSIVDRATGTEDPGRLGRLVAWLRVGKRLAYATSALGILGAALQAALSSAPWTVILAAAVAAAFKLIVPVPPSSLIGPTGGGDGPPTTPAAVS